MNTRKRLNQARKLRISRARAKIKTANHPRLSVFRSNRHVYAQVIKDDEGRTIASAFSWNISGEKIPKTEKAREVGRAVARRAKEAGLGKVVFDKGGYSYHGRVKALAEGAREEGLEF